jgi:hypothetical protein
MTQPNQSRSVLVVAQAKRAKGKTINNQQADEPMAADNANAKSAGTPRVEFLGVGANGDGDRFLKRRIGSFIRNPMTIMRTVAITSST